MDRTGFHHIGSLTKIRGVKGGMILKYKKGLFEELSEKEPVFLDIDGGLVPFFVSAFEELDADTAVVRFEDITSSERAVLLQGMDVYTEGKENGKAHPHGSLEGFEVFDEKAGKLGIVTGFMEVPGNPLIRVSTSKKEIYLPLQPELILAIDADQKKITFRLPEGLIELNS